MLEPVKKVSLTDSIVRQLVSYIQTDLRAGDRLPSERNLIEMLEVGRTSIRESLRALEMLGIVVTKPGEGTYVCNNQNDLLKKPIELGVFSNNKSVKEIYEARRVIEIGMVPLIIEKITDSEIDQCKSVLIKMKYFDSDHFDDFIKCDQQFHRILTISTDNGIVTEVLKLTHRILEEEREVSYLSQKDLKKSVKLHKSIIESIEKRDVELTTEAVEAHMNWTRIILGIDN